MPKGIYHTLSHTCILEPSRTGRGPVHFPIQNGECLCRGPVLPNLNSSGSRHFCTTEQTGREAVAGRPVVLFEPPHLSLRQRRALAGSIKLVVAMKSLPCVFLILFALSTAASGQGGPAIVKSPDGRLELGFRVASGKLVYTVSYQGKPLIIESPLALAIQNQPPLGENVRMISARQSAADETYRVVYGKSNPIRNRYNMVQVNLEEPEGRLARKLVIEGRAYDDGVAFRYVVPDQPDLKELRLAAEKTQFRLAKDSTTYPLFLRNFRTSYETVYQTVPTSSIQPDWLIGLPLLVQAPGVAWMAITEAHLENYAGLYLHKANVQGSRMALEARLAPRVDEPELCVTGRTPMQSPWRVLMIASDPGRLIESNLVINLNPPAALADTSWIHPGKSAWDWWSGEVVTGQGFKGGMNTETMEYYIDFAAKAGLEYMLIDDGWSPRGDITRTVPAINMPEILRHAASKGVKVWLWMHWTSVDAQMDEAFPLFEKWGIAGVKIDFMDRDDQWMVDFYHRVVKNAAQHHLMVDFHGAYKPTGFRRTYPNLVTREGVQGLEYAKWSIATDPAHDVMLPFTRMLAGPMDYTPGGFDNVTKADFIGRRVAPMVMGTRAHQLALFVVFESPFQVLADHPAAYEGQPGFDLIRHVPTTWDETRVLNAWPGRFVTIARRHGKEWYVGSITDWMPRELNIPLSFLPEGKFTAEIYADGPDAAQFPKNLAIEKKDVDRKLRLKALLAPGGGHAIRIHPAE
jgi:alpha-glucosidase